MQTTFSDGLNHVAGALGVFPVGRWASAVLALARLLGRGDLFDLVNRRRDQLAPEELTQADEYCRQEMDTGASPRTSLIEYSRWRGSAKRAVRKRSAMRSTTRKAADEQAEQERARCRKPQRRERTKGE